MQHPVSPGAGSLPRSVSVVLAGSGGSGVMTAGNMLLEAAAHAGYYALMTRSSGPQIRGGEAAAMLRIACEPVECMEDRFHVLAAVDWENVQRFSAEIPLGTVEPDPRRPGPGRATRGLREEWRGTRDAAAQEAREVGARGPRQHGAARGARRTARPARRGRRHARSRRRWASDPRHWHRASPRWLPAGPRPRPSRRAFRSPSRRPPAAPAGC